MVKNLISVETSKDGKRKYATDSKGSPFFPQTAAIGEKLTAGCWANVLERERNMTRNEKGELVELDHPVKEWIITAVFTDKKAALEANTADAVFEMESKAFINSQVDKIATEYKVDAKTLSLAI